MTWWEAYQRDGVVLVRGLWTDWVEMLRAGVARNMASPTHQMPTLKPGEPGFFFDGLLQLDADPRVCGGDPSVTGRRSRCAADAVGPGAVVS